MRAAREARALVPVVRRLVHGARADIVGLERFYLGPKEVVGPKGG